MATFETYSDALLAWQNATRQARTLRNTIATRTANIAAAQAAIAQANDNLATLEATRRDALAAMEQLV